MESDSLLNVAAYFIGTRALGPGLRSALWLQGCPFRCEGCYSPDWIPDTPAHRYSARDLAKILSANETIEGITISGGEPFLQYVGLGSLVKSVRHDYPQLSIIIYTGYRRQVLEKISYIGENVFPYIDILIDGNYIQRLNDGKGLRGSSNQNIHHFSIKYKDFDFETQQRKNEIHLQDNHIQLIGIPDRLLSSSLGAIEKSVKV
jgi:anaerobic ribonucleoside-triphosphate reductase activating protein